MEATRLTIFAITYVLIALRRVPYLHLTRPGAALLGAVAMIVLGGLSLRDAYAAIDASVIVFLAGVMLLTAHLEIAGFFDVAARWLARRFTSPRSLLGAVVVAGGVLSAFFMNDTMCLVLTPVVLASVRALRVRALPFLLAVALSANVGSAMAITGNPQNMLIGVSSGIGFGAFMAALALPSLGGLAIVYVVVLLVFRKDLRAVPDASARAPELAARGDATYDRPLIIKSLVVFGGALAGWLAGAPLALVAIAAGAVLMLIARRDPTIVIRQVEWPLIVFFAALFVVTAGVRDSTPVVRLTDVAIRHVGGGSWREASVLSGAMLALSNIVSNVPAVLLWLPVIPVLPHANLAWLVMAMSATFAGNLTLLGSVANLIVAESARSHGVTVGFLDFLKAGVPITILTITWGIVTLLLVT